MDEEGAKNRQDEIYEELTKLMQEWVNITDPGDGTSGLMTGCIIAFEATRYDDEGVQQHRTDYVTLPPTGMSAGIGLLKVSLWEMNHRMFCHG